MRIVAAGHTRRMGLKDLFSGSKKEAPQPDPRTEDEKDKDAQDSTAAVTAATTSATIL